MNKKTIGLIIILMMLSGVGGYIFGSQNSQSLPIILSNNTTDDSDYSNYDKPTTTIKKNTTTTKKNTTTSNKTTTPIVKPNGTSNITG